MNVEELKAGAIQYRAAEVKDINVPNREMLVKVAPYEVTMDIGGGIDETFKRGTFSRAVKAPQRVSAFWEHGGPLIGRGVQVDDREDGVWVRAKIGRTTAAADVISLIEDELIRDVSAEFRPIPESMTVMQSGGRLSVTHTRAHLIGFAVVREGAYGKDAYVSSVRDERMERDREALRLWLQGAKAHRL